MDTSFEWKIVVGQRRFTSRHRKVGGEKEDRKNHEERSDGLHEKQKHGRRYGIYIYVCVCVCVCVLTYRHLIKTFIKETSNTDSRKWIN